MTHGRAGRAEPAQGGLQQSLENGHGHGHGFLDRLVGRLYGTRRLLVGVVVIGWYGIHAFNDENTVQTNESCIPYQQHATSVLQQVEHNTSVVES